jgi:hypothetical protein
MAQTNFDRQFLEGRLAGDMTPRQESLVRSHHLSRLEKEDSSYGRTPWPSLHNNRSIAWKSMVPCVVLCRPDRGIPFSAARDGVPALRSVPIRLRSEDSR